MLLGLSREFLVFGRLGQPVQLLAFRWIKFVDHRCFVTLEKCCVPLSLLFRNLKRCDHFLAVWSVRLVFFLLVELKEELTNLGNWPRVALADCVLARSGFVDFGAFRLFNVIILKLGHHCEHRDRVPSSSVWSKSSFFCNIHGPLPVSTPLMCVFRKHFVELPSVKP